MEDWAAIAMRIADAAGIPLLERLALLLGLALLVLVFGKMKGLRLPPYRESEPPLPSSFPDNVQLDPDQPGGPNQLGG